MSFSLNGHHPVCGTFTRASLASGWVCASLQPCLEAQEAQPSESYPDQHTKHHTALKNHAVRLLGRSRALLAAPLVCTRVADSGVVMSGEEGPNWDPFSFLSGPKGSHSCMHIYTSSCAQDTFPIKFKVPGFKCAHSFPTASSSSPRLWRKVCPPLLGKMPLGTRNERFTAVLTGIQHLD